MTPAGLVKALVILVLVFWTVIELKWPRDPHGRKVDPETLARWLEQRCIREPDRVDGQSFISTVILLVGMLACVLS